MLFSLNLLQFLFHYFWVSRDFFLWIIIYCIFMQHSLLSSALFILIFRVQRRKRRKRKKLNWSQKMIKNLLQFIWMVWTIIEFPGTCAYEICYFDIKFALWLGKAEKLCFLLWQIFFVSVSSFGLIVPFHLLWQYLFQHLVPVSSLLFSINILLLYLKLFLVSSCLSYVTWISWNATWEFFKSLWKWFIDLGLPADGVETL